MPQINADFYFLICAICEICGFFDGLGKTAVCPVLVFVYEELGKTAVLPNRTRMLRTRICKINADFFGYYPRLSVKSAPIRVLFFADDELGGKRPFCVECNEE